MFTLKLGSYHSREKDQLLDFLGEARCYYFPESYVVTSFEENVGFCYKCVYRHFCKDIVTTVNYLEEKTCK